jgi:hypothetical protein
LPPGESFLPGPWTPLGASIFYFSSSRLCGLPRRLPVKVRTALPFHKQILEILSVSGWLCTHECTCLLGRQPALFSIARSGVSHETGRRSAQNATAGPGQGSGRTADAPAGTPPPTEPAKPGSPPDDLKKIREEAERRRRGDPSPDWRPLVFSRWVAPDTPSTGPAEPDDPPPDDSPLSDLSWKKVLEELGRRVRGIGTQYTGLPPWLHRTLQAAKARIKLSPRGLTGLTKKEQERFNFLLQWQRQEEQDWNERREAAIEARDLWQQEREQERRAQEQQERERQAEQIEKLERSRLDLEERLDSIGALIDKAIDGVDIQANLIAAKALTARQRAAGERSGEVRANKAWHAAARKIISDNPELGHAALVRKIEKEAKPPVEPRTVERFVTDELSRK